MLSLKIAYSLLGDQESAGLFLQEELDLDELPRKDDFGAVRDDRPHFHRPGVDVDFVVDEIDPAVFRKSAFVGENYADGQVVLAMLLEYLGYVALGDAEIYVHRVELDHRGELRRIARCPDQVADVHIPPADTARERSVHSAVAQVELGLCNVGLGGFDCSLTLDLFRHVSVVSVLGDVLLLHDRLITPYLLLCISQRRPALREVGLGRLEVRLERPRVYNEQERPFLDIGPVLKRPLYQEPLDPGVDVDSLYGLSGPYVFEVDRDRLRRYFRHRYRKRGGGWFLILAAASRRYKEKGES